MEPSLFLAWINKYFPALTVRVVETLNDTQRPLAYKFLTMLTLKYSIDGKWESLNESNSLVTADYVAMDSPLPLKKRDSISRATGNIPKSGMELSLNETQLKALDVLIAMGGQEPELIKRLFADTPKVIGGIYEKIEAALLMGLSTGQALFRDDTNTGIGVRLDYKFLAENKFGVAKLLTDPTALFWDDVQRVIDKATADGKIITKAYTDSATIKKIGNLNQTKQLYGFGLGFVGGNIPAPALADMNTLAQKDYGFTFEAIDRIVTSEKNGVRTSYKPFAAGAITFLVSDNVGDLIYTDLAEDNHRHPAVTYSKPTEYILVKNYRDHKPSLGEFTSSQAFVAPVITNLDEIYLMDSTTVQA